MASNGRWWYIMYDSVNMCVRPLLCSLFYSAVMHTASSVFNPLDVVKVRLQTQARNTVVLKYHGFFHATTTILREEGFWRGLMRGLTPSILRELLYSSLRIGLYDPFRQIFAPGVPPNEISLYQRILAGLASGAIGSAIATPTDLVKIRFQAELPGRPPRYRNTIHAFWCIYRDEGIRGLYRGIGPTTLRAAILTSAQLSSYDHCKHFLKNTGLIRQDSMVLHIIASIISGLVTTTASSPVDVIKSRIMNTPTTGSIAPAYRGPVDCLIRSVRNEGLGVLMRGWVPNYLRLGPHFIISLPLYEQLRRLFGAGYM